MEKKVNLSIWPALESSFDYLKRLFLQSTLAEHDAS